MTDPITPPPELAQRLWNNFRSSCESETDSATAWNEAIAEAFQAGADQELEACREWLREDHEDGMTADFMHEARRPRSPDLKQQALKDLDLLMADLRTLGMGFRDTNIRRALED